MQPTVNADEGAITLGFEEPAAIGKFFEETEKQAGFFLQLARQPKQFQRFDLTAKAPRGVRFRFQAEVVQVFPGAGGFGCAFQLYGWSESKKKELARKLGGGAGEEDEANVSPAFRIRKMNPNERFRLATKASRPERQVLLRDTSPQVLLGLLAHPRIEDKEVKAILASNYSSSAIMQRVAENRKWMSNSDIQIAIVKSPKTPPPLALKILPNLRTTDLQVLAKGSYTREALKKAALKLYLQRISRR